MASTAARKTSKPISSRRAAINVEDTRPAVQKVLGTVELLEQVLLHLPMYDLLINSHRGCHIFKDTVDYSKPLQEKLFFRQVAGKTPETKDVEMNPFFFFFLPFGNDSAVMSKKRLIPRGHNLLSSAKWYSTKPGLFVYGATLTKPRDLFHQDLRLRSISTYPVSHLLESTPSITIDFQLVSAAASGDASVRGSWQRMYLSREKVPINLTPVSRMKSPTFSDKTLSELFDGDDYLLYKSKLRPRK